MKAPGEGGFSTFTRLTELDGMSIEPAAKIVRRADADAQAKERRMVAAIVIGLIVALVMGLRTEQKLSEQLKETPAERGCGWLMAVLFVLMVITLITLAGAAVEGGM